MKETADPELPFLLSLMRFGWVPISPFTTEK